MKLFKNERAYENFHIFVWLIKDSSWVHNWRWLGMVMVIPTLAMQLHITWKNRKDYDELAHNIAITMWITANATWMCSEFYFHDHFRYVAAWFFNIGLAIMVAYYGRILYLIWKPANKIN